MNVLITGASSGIGKALVEQYAQQGATHVYAAARRVNELEALARRYENVTAVPFDAANLAALPAFVHDMVHAKEIDHFVVNAGVQRGFDFTKPKNVALDLLDQEMLVNYTSPVHMTAEILRELPPHRHATIFFTTSGLALIPMPRAPNYSASKHALRAFIIAVRRQLAEAKSPVKLVEILPPAVQTELHDDKHQPEYKGKGSAIGAPLDEYIGNLFPRMLKGDEDEIGYELSARALEAIGKTQRMFSDKLPVGTGLPA